MKWLSLFLSKHTALFTVVKRGFAILARDIWITFLLRSEELNSIVQSIALKLSFRAAGINALHWFIATSQCP